VFVSRVTRTRPRTGLGTPTTVKLAKNETCGDRSSRQTACSQPCNNRLGNTAPAFEKRRNLRRIPSNTITRAPISAENNNVLEAKGSSCVTHIGGAVPVRCFVVQGLPRPLSCAHIFRQRNTITSSGKVLAEAW